MSSAVKQLLLKQSESWKVTVKHTFLEVTDSGDDAGAAPRLRSRCFSDSDLRRRECLPVEFKTLSLPDACLEDASASSTCSGDDLVQGPEAASDTSPTASGGVDRSAATSTLGSLPSPLFSSEMTDCLSLPQTPAHYAPQSGAAFTRVGPEDARGLQAPPEPQPQPQLQQQGLGSLYDFVYLPIDFNYGAALGYAFINVVDEHAVDILWRAFDGFKRWGMPSRKRCSVSWSDPYQGFEENVEHYRNSPVMHHSVPDDYRPIVFSGGKRIPYPAPTKAVRPPRVRRS